MLKNYKAVIPILLFIIMLGNVSPIKADYLNKSDKEPKEREYLEIICDSFSKYPSHDPEILKSTANRLLHKDFSDNTKFFSYGNYMLAEAEYYRQNYKESLEKYELSLTGFKTLKDTYRTAVIYSTIGIVHFILGNDDKACEAYLNGFDLYKELDDKRGLGDSYNNLALIYWRADNFEKADYYQLLGINMYKEVGETRSLADMYNNYAANLVKKKQYDKALFYYQQAFNIYQTLGEETGKSIITFNIGELYLAHQNNIDSASFYFNKAHQAFSRDGDTINLVYSYKKLAEINILNKEFKEAISNLTVSELLNKKIKSLDATIDIHKDFAQCYEALGYYKEALNRSRTFAYLNDSISKAETQERIAEIESKFMVEQTQKELKLSQQESELKSFAIIIIILLFFVIGMILFFYWQHYRIKEEQRVLMLEHKVLRTQMDPHFIFNSLSALQCYIMDNKPDEAIRFLSDFSALLRLVLQYSKSELVPITKEKTILDYYLALQNRRFDDKIKFSIDIDEELLLGDVLIPPMLAQPFIENSLEHAGLDKTEDSTIIVTFTKINNCIKLSIVDNGIGIEKSLLHLKEYPIHKSMAISITHERLKLINSHQKVKIDLQITDLSRVGLRGTKVEFTIPFKNTL